MAELIRTDPSANIPGVGFVRRGVITTVPDDMAAALLATGEWQAVTEAEAERVTEPAPSTPVRRPEPKKKR